MEVAGGQHVLHQLDGQLEPLAPARRGELSLHGAHQEHDRELESLGLVDGEDAHGRRLGVGLRHGGVVPRVDQRIEVLHELADVVVAERARRVVDLPEEPADVLDLGLVARRRRA